MKLNILFTCAGRRNYLIDHFKEALNGCGNIIAVDEQNHASALMDADISYVVPNIYDDKYISVLIEIVKKHSVKAIISLNDLELPIIAKNKDLFEQNGAKAIVSSPAIIDICFDKWKTFNYLKKLNFNVPKTFIDLNKATIDIENGKLNFPLVLKPRWGSSSIGIEYPESMEELELAFKLLEIKIKRTTLNAAHGKDFESSILIQEKLQGKEFGLDIVNNFDGKYFSSFVREKLAMRSGETDKAKSVINDDFDKLSKKIGSHLKHIGNMDVDAFLVKNKLFVIDLNPRFGGGYPFSHEAGADIASVFIDWLKGHTDIEVMKHINYKEDITYSKCDKLLKVSDKKHN